MTPTTDKLLQSLNDLYWHISRKALQDGSPFAMACMGALPALNAAIATLASRAAAEDGNAVGWEVRRPVGGVDVGPCYFHGEAGREHAEHFKAKGYRVRALVYATPSEPPAAEDGEAVATVCLRGERYGSDNFIEVQLQKAPGVTFPIGTKFYLRPQPATPSEPTASGAVVRQSCVVCGHWNNRGERCGTCGSHV